ncbi:Hypothetical_protein [Hexamita inflata]|uniref:Hypothetical_protein n=1 Tax=Hexamita inflata TaxID=28002 RepID=A0ABP1H8L0_9EUKA
MLIEQNNEKQIINLIINEQQIENNQFETLKSNTNEQEANLVDRNENINGKENNQIKTINENQIFNEQKPNLVAITNQNQNQEEHETKETIFEQNNSINTINDNINEQLSKIEQNYSPKLNINEQNVQNQENQIPTNNNNMNNQIEIKNDQLALNELEPNQTVEIVVKDFQPDKTAKVIKMLKKQFTQVMQASADEDNDCIYLTVLQSDNEYVMKTIKKMKIEDKKLTCAINTTLQQNVQKQNIIKQEEQPETNKKPLYHRRKVTNKINTEEYANDNLEMCEIEVDLQQFSREQTPKLLKTLNKKLENILSSTVLENGNISVKLYKIYKKETINMIQRFKIGDTKLVCIKQSKSKLNIMQTASMLNESLQEQECSVQEIITDIINSCIEHAILSTQADK